MKDRIGTEVEVGDIVLSSATREGGYFRIGKVTKLYDDGSPCIRAVAKKFDWDGKSELGRYVPAWYNGKAGTNLLVLGKTDSRVTPIRLFDEINRDYDAEVPE